MTRGKLTINLVAVAAASAVLLVYAFTQLLAGAMFDRSYPLFVRLPESGGLLAEQEVSVAGRVVGRVRDVRLEGAGVVAELAINQGQQVPVGSQVVVLRRSPVGEQALDFRPRGSADEFHDAGDEIDATEDGITPVAVQRLLSLADEVLAGIDTQNAAAVVSELARTAEGRSESLRRLIIDSARFSTTIADNGADYDRLFREGRRVSGVLAEHRQTLARSIGEMADAAAVLSDMRTEFEGLLEEAPGTLDQITGMVDRSQANLSCVVTDIAALNAYMARPEQQENAAGALNVNQWFFVGFDILSPYDPFGAPWNRIEFMLPQEPPALSYLPAKRPIPDILPGGACSSPFGNGAPSATQAGFAQRVPEARVVRPEDDRTDPVRIAGAPLGAGPCGGGSTGRAVSTSDARGLPATGGAGMLLVAGLALAAAAARTAAHLRRPLHEDD
jgi:virulence factor Mce-like protein